MRERCRHIDLSVCWNLHLLASQKDLEALQAMTSGKDACVRRLIKAILCWLYHHMLMSWISITGFFDNLSIINRHDFLLINIKIILSSYCICYDKFVFLWITLIFKNVESDSDALCREIGHLRVTIKSYMCFHTTVYYNHNVICVLSSY